MDLGPRRRRRYGVRVSYSDRPGHYKQRYLGYYATVKEAQAALDEYNAEGRTPEARGITLGEVYEQWSERKFRKIGQSAQKGYNNAWARLSVLKDKEMAFITLDDLQGVVDAQEREGIAPGTIVKYKSLMGALYRHAMERDIVSKDWSQFVELPKAEARVKKDALTEEQVSKVREMAEAEVPWADTVLLLCYTGFRISEFLALTPDSFHRKGDICWLQGGMKTEAGKNRVVPVHPSVQGYLEAWLRKGGKRLICGPLGGGIGDSDYRADCFSPIVEALGVPEASPHWCRYTAASRMRMAGVDPVAIKRILGHADADITGHYTKVTVEYLFQEMKKVP